MRVQITKAQRSRIANELAHVVAEVFGVPLPHIAQDELDGSSYRSSVMGDALMVQTSAGPTLLTIDVSPRLVSVFTRFDGPMTDAMRGMAIRCSGNQFSGKINFHAAPDGKASAQWCEDVVHAYRAVAEAMLRDR